MPSPPATWLRHSSLLWNTVYWKVNLLLPFMIAVQSPSRVWLSETPWTAAQQALRPSPAPRVCPGSCPVHWWSHATISSSVSPFSFCPQSFPASKSFLMSWLFASGDQNIGASVSTSVLPMSIQGWFPLGWTSWISLLSKGLSWVFSNTTVQRYQFLGTLPLYGPPLTTVCDHWKGTSLNCMHLCWQADVFAFHHTV